VSVAASVERALAMLREVSLDLIVTDLRMALQARVAGLACCS